MEILFFMLMIHVGTPQAHVQLLKTPEDVCRFYQGSGFAHAQIYRVSRPAMSDEELLKYEDFDEEFYSGPLIFEPGEIKCAYIKAEFTPKEGK